MALIVAIGVLGLAACDGGACDGANGCEQGDRFDAPPAEPSYDAGHGGVGERVAGGSEGGGGGPCEPTAPAACGIGRACHLGCSMGLVSTSCGPVGAGRVGELCRSEGDCAAGAGCLAQTCGDGRGVSVCARYCRTDQECAGGRCLPIPCGGGPSGHRACTIPCDPRSSPAGGCAAGLTCQLLGQGGDVTSCVCPSAAGTVAEGAACDDGTRACRPGFICAAEGIARICRPICRRASRGDCAAGRECTPVPGYSVYGACVPSPPTPSRPYGDCAHLSPSSCGAGRACRVECTQPGLGRTTCAAAGARTTGQRCDSADDCAPGHDCISHACGDGTHVSRCLRYCQVDADCGTGSSRCELFLCDGRLSRFGTCSDQCDPVGAGGGGCPPGLSCALFPGDVTSCICRTGRAYAKAGGVCGGDTRCDAGLACVRRGGSSVCRPICRTGSNECPAGQACVELPDHRAYGACVPVAGDAPPVCDPTSPATCPGGNGCFVGCAGEYARAYCGPVGPAAVGEACTSPGPSQCVAGAVCLVRTCDDGGTRGVCQRSCRTDRDCGGGSSRCAWQYSCSGVGLEYGMCTTPCDPRPPAQNGCPTGLVCQLGSGDVTDCRCPARSQVVADGGACASDRDCLPGLRCVTGDRTRTCRPICRLDAPTACPATSVCTPLPDQRIFGACLPRDTPAGQPSPLRFEVRPPPPDGTVGVPYFHDFCGPGAAPPTQGLSLIQCSPPPGGTPSGGHPPYHFQLDSGVGFPPMNLRLQKDGVLDGTPSAAGTATFRVCAVDLDANQACVTVTMTIHSNQLRFRGTWRTFPLSPVCPGATGTWAADFTIRNRRLTGTWRDSYHNQDFAVDVPMNELPMNRLGATWTVGQGNDSLTLMGVFDLSVRTVGGTLVGPVCTPAAGRWNGEFAGAAP